MSIFFCCLLTLLSSTALATPAWPHPGGRLSKRDDFYPVHNPTDTCYDYEVLDNRGKSNAAFQPADTYPTVQGITRGRSNGNYWENPESTNFDLGNYIARKTAICPTTKYVLVAFSYGTRLATTTMQNSTLDLTNVVSVILYGDGFWREGRSENRGSATMGHGAFTAGSSVIIPAMYESITRSYCNINDWECQNLPQNSTTLAAHHTYVNSTLQDDAVAFSLSQLDLASAPSGSQGVIQRRKRARLQQVIGDATMCAAGFSFCPTRDSEEWSCIATDAALEHCGGCPGGPVRLGYGKDCTSIMGVDQVACVSGACQVKYLHVWKDTSQPKTGYDAAEQDHLPRYRYPVPDRRSVRCIRVVTLQGYWARTTALHTTTAVAAAIPTSLVVAADRHSNVGRPSHFVGGLIPEGTQEE